METTARLIAALTYVFVSAAAIFSFPFEAGAMELRSHQLMYNSAGMDLHYIEQLKKRLASDTNGEIRIKEFNIELCRFGKDVFQILQHGRLSIGMVSLDSVQDIFDYARILTTPFLFENGDELDYIFGQLKALIGNEFEKQGYFVLGYVKYRTVYMFCRFQPLRVADFNDKKFFGYQGLEELCGKLEPSYKGVFRFYNVYDGYHVAVTAKREDMDVLFMPVDDCTFSNCCSRMKYFLNMHVQPLVIVTLIRKKDYQALSENGKIHLKKYYADTTSYVNDFYQKKFRADMEELRAKGLVVVEPSMEQREYFRQLSRSIVEDKIHWGFIDKEKYDRVEKVLTDYRKK